MKFCIPDGFRRHVILHFHFLKLKLGYRHEVNLIKCWDYVKRINSCRTYFVIIWKICDKPGKWENFILFIDISILNQWSKEWMKWINESLVSKVNLVLCHFHQPNYWNLIRWEKSYFHSLCSRLSECEYNSWIENTHMYSKRFCKGRLQKYFIFWDYKLYPQILEVF